MKDIKNKINNLIDIKISFILISIVVVISYLSLANSNVVKVKGTSIKNVPFFENGTTYVPLNEVAENMGDKVTGINGSEKVVIQQEKANTISITSEEARAIIMGKIVPLKTKKINNVIVPQNTKAVSKNGQIYIPIEFISSKNGLNHSVKIDGSVIYIGTISTLTEQKDKTKESTTKPTESKSVAKNSSNSNNGEENGEKQDASYADSDENEQQTSTKGKTYPDGWTAPVLKSAWSSNHQTNLATLQNELGFVDGGKVFTFDTVPQAIGVMGNSPTSKYEVYINFYLWDNTSNGLIPEAYRVPIVAKELFKLYFEKDYMTVWNYFDKNDIPDNFTANGRNVHALYDDKTGAIVLQVGRK